MRLWPEATTEFQRQWNRNFLTVFLPGAVVFGIGAASSLTPVVLGGWVIAAVGLLRGFRILRYFRTCTGCGRLNYTRLGNDDSCLRCGIELPLNGPD